MFYEDIREIDHPQCIDVTERKSKKESIAGSDFNLWFLFC
jgi:hypothetical protein